MEASEALLAEVIDLLNQLDEYLEEGHEPEKQREAQRLYSALYGLAGVLSLNTEAADA